ncbi:MULTISPECIES: reverse transcriptase family protein [Xanthomonas]|uniref:reverse transcriptase family protein n=1 Tax=Xanthomonas TaxID=338 RepID=UPI000F814556|nr:MULTISPECIES: reverse transcriptase family protein [Xanthomonas]MCP3042185.1 reverse transcriptase family protein [Xanthomonas euvesicatoria pv. allii]MEE5090605.1 reverse transcriptase family protein [Xanthomonas euvesicatoria]RTE58625.1 RNA-directed DNA polymerase [Xanthomonas axonopodis pv. eucalyptorum]
MSDWHSQRYRKAAPAGQSSAVIDAAIQTASITKQVNAKLPPIFSLRHLSHYTSINYNILRAVVSRSRRESYRSFQIQKRSGRGASRFRSISVPSPALMQVQRWINQRILQQCKVDEASVAFAKHATLTEAAKIHCQSRWLIKIDVRNFFHSINEISVYRVFKSLGYQPLVAFELARLCTRQSLIGPGKQWENFRSTKDDIQAALDDKPVMWSSDMVIKSYDSPRQGYLPQGAPTSPMLSNLVMRSFDQKLRDLASESQFYYTRYADDITLSTTEPSSRATCLALMRKVYQLLHDEGLSPNAAKVQIVPPGAKKIVLGLLVNGDTPRLTREFRLRLRHHLYYLEKPNGPVEHAAKRDFASVSGLRHHLFGLAAYASQIEPAYGAQIQQRLRSIPWPA